MNKLTKVLPLLTLLILSGCGSVNVQDNLISMDKNYFDNKKLQTSITSNKNKYPKLDAAYTQIHNISLSKDKNLSKLLPVFMASEPLIIKIIDSSYNSLIKMEPEPINITLAEMKNFSQMIVRNYGPQRKYGKESDKEIHKIIKEYLITYYSDKNGFIDREGSIFKRPDVKNKIGNDIITTVAMIVLEGFYDGILDVPVYTKTVNKKTVFLTRKGAEPTVSKLKYAEGKDIVTNKNIGITKTELKAIRYLSGLAADQSKTLSGFVVRSFSGLEIGFVIGGDFAFGDNDTLAELLDTLFEVSSKRIAEAGAYKGFYDFTRDKITIEDSATANRAAFQLLKTIEWMECKETDNEESEECIGMED